MSRPTTAWLWRELRRHNGQTRGPARMAPGHPTRTRLRSILWRHLLLESTISGRHSLGELMSVSGVVWGGDDV